jgi:AsnC-type helix-turn-helix domain
MRRRRRYSPTEPNARANRQRSGIDLPGHTRIVPKSPAKRHSESKALSSQKLMKHGVSAHDRHEIPRLDETDRKILGELVTDGRVPLAELGRRVTCRHRLSPTG